MEHASQITSLIRHLHKVENLKRSSPLPPFSSKQQIKWNLHHPKCILNHSNSKPQLEHLIQTKIHQCSDKSTGKLKFNLI